MNIIEHAHQILFSNDLSEKLSIFPLDKKFEKFAPIEVPALPGREDKHKFNEKQTKFPKRTSLHLIDKKAQALHFFAGHELQALEMMAAGILLFPTETEEDHKFKLGIMNTIQDEKKHFILYRNRMNDLGADFGDFGIGNFFWKQLSKIKTKAQYYSFVALTLEAANLDFAKYYAEVFREVDDHETAKILDIVYEDEITHVAIGRKWLNLWRGNEDLWDYYLKNLPGFITPARAKGIIFDKEGRQKAGLDLDFISRIQNYRDGFAITDRRGWK